MQETQKSSASGAIGGESESRKAKGLWDRMSCKVCPPDCPNCTSSTPCGVEYNMHLLRGIPLAVQTFSITTTLLLGVLTFRLRRTRVDLGSFALYLLPSLCLCSLWAFMKANGSLVLIAPWIQSAPFSGGLVFHDSWCYISPLHYYYY